MSEYEYRAVNCQGVVSTGVMEANSESVLERKLTDFGYTLIEANERKKAVSFSLKSGRVTRKDLLNFTVYLHTTVSSGIPIISAIEGFIAQEKEGKFKTIMKSLVLNIQDGDMFAEALKRYPDAFPNLYVHLIEAGEAAGKLEESLENLISYIEGQEAIMAQTKQATVYPIFMLSLVAALIIFIFTFVLPQFAPIFESTGVELPASAKLLLGISNIFKKGWIFMLSGVVMLIALYRFMPRSSSTALFFDRIKLRIPIFGDLIMKIGMSQFSYNMSTLLNSGIDISKAFSLSGNVVQNKLISSALTNVHLRIRGGDSITDAMKESALFPPMVTQMLSVGEDTGSMPFAFKKINEYYERDVAASIKRAFSILGPTLTVILGVVVGGIAVTIFLTLYKVIIAVGQS